MAVNLRPGDTSEQLSKEDMIAWVNGSLSTNYTEIHQLFTGAAYCQLLDMLFENCIPINKVKFQANSKDECLSNFRLLQTGFRKVGLNKRIPVDSLIGGNFTPNFEFAQWFKKFFDANSAGQDIEAYNALEARGGVQPVPRQSGGRPQKKSSYMPPRKLQIGNNNSTQRAPKNTAVKKIDEQMVQSLTEEVADLRSNVDVLEKERDFYFGKLRNIEVICQEEAYETLRDKVLEVLYATEEGFADSEFSENSDAEEQVEYWARGGGGGGDGGGGDGGGGGGGGGVLSARTISPWSTERAYNLSTSHKTLFRFLFVRLYSVHICFRIYSKNKHTQAPRF